MATNAINSSETPDLNSSPAIGGTLGVRENDIAVLALLVPALGQVGVLGDFGELDVPEAMLV